MSRALFKKVLAEFGSACPRHHDEWEEDGCIDELAAALDAALTAQEGERGVEWEEGYGQGLLLGRTPCEAMDDEYAQCHRVLGHDGPCCQVDSIVLAAQEGERGGAEVAAAVEAVLVVWERKIGTSWLIEDTRAVLADPAGALATHDAEVLRAAADDFETDMARVWGGDASWLTTGSHIGQLVADVLREMASERADRIASGGQP